jgi:hypothetical protein
LSSANAANVAKKKRSSQTNLTKSISARDAMNRSILPSAPSREKAKAFLPGKKLLWKNRDN